MTIREAALLAAELMVKHGLYGWSFKFNNSKRQRGVCKHGPRRIELSRHLLKLGDAEVRNTILHEIAHALVPVEHGHDAVWRRKAREIGCSGERCGVSMGVKRKFKGVCPSCGAVTLKHRRMKLACRKCCATHNHGKFDERFAFNWGMNHD